MRMVTIRLGLSRSLQDTMLISTLWTISQDQTKKSPANSKIAKQVLVGSYATVWDRWQKKSSPSNSKKRRMPEQKATGKALQRQRASNTLSMWASQAQIARQTRASQLRLSRSPHKMDGMSMHQLKVGPISVSPVLQLRWKGEHQAVQQMIIHLRSKSHRKLPTFLAWTSRNPMRPLARLKMEQVVQVFGNG